MQRPAAADSDGTLQGTQTGVAPTFCDRGSDVDSVHARLGREGHEAGAVAGQRAFAQLER
jgi:hypothetical protein